MVLKMYERSARERERERNFVHLENVPYFPCAFSNPIRSKYSHETKIACAIEKKIACVCDT